MRVLRLLAALGLAAAALVAVQEARLRFASGEDSGPARRPAPTVTSTSAPVSPVSERLVPREGAW